jgi:glycosyltransferase involved in cell wall biosynthesis
MKRLLIISPYFPPMGGSGVYRITRIVKHIREFGWEPLIISMDKFYGGSIDNELFMELPRNLTVQRVPYFEPSLRGIKHILKKRVSNVLTKNSTVIQNNSNNQNNFVSRIRREFLLPDIFITWMPFALNAAKKIFRKLEVHAVMSTSTPNTSHLIGAWCADYASIPWIADFRDFWSLATCEENRSSVSADILRRMELKVLKRADHILTYSNKMKERQLSEFQEISPDKVSVMPAALDMDKFKSVKKYHTWDVVQAGNLNSSYPLNFLNSIKEINRRRDQKGLENISCGLAGNLTPDVYKKITSVNDANIKILGYIPHEQAQSMITSAKVLILSLPLKNSDWWVPGKIAEYMASGNPIVAIVPPGETSDMLKQYGSAWIVPDEPVAIADAIEQALRSEKKEGVSLPEIMTARGQAKFVAELADRLSEDK